MAIAANEQATAADVLSLQAQFVNTEVFNGVAPTAFADLDLSGVVGSNFALVMLRVSTESDATYNTLHTRPNGGAASGGTVVNTSQYFKNGASATLLQKTDSSGIIEWYNNSADFTVVVTVLAYIPKKF